MASDRGDLHVVPINDWIEHPQAVSCPCRPTVVDLGPGPRVVIHHAADGREAYEPGLFEGELEPEVVQ